MSLDGLLKGVFGGNPSTNTNEAKEKVVSDKKKNKRTKRNIFLTEGGASGQELQSDQVRGTLFGN